jgi:hypothetical protein
MRRIISIIITITFIITGFGAFAQQENINNKIIIISDQIIVSKPSFIGNDNYISIHIEGSESYFMQPGQPLLPIISKLFTFPFESEIIDINIEIETETYKLPRIITPCPYFSILKNINNEKDHEDEFIDQKTHNLNVLYPKQPYKIFKSTGLKNNEQILFCNVQVITQYNPSKNIIKVPKNIIITIKYIPPKNPLFTKNNEYDMVIIAPEVFSTQIQRLINHKNNIGVLTFSKTTEEIYNQYNGVDKPEQIKYFIKDAVEQYGIKYVFLIGDIYHVPMRKTAVTWNYFGDLVVPDVITDLYYSDIYDQSGSFSNWDTNQDGVYSEIRMIMNYQPYNETLEIIDEIDGNPDVIIGRLPCSNNRDVRNIVNKIITYETTTFGIDWFNKMILMGGDTFPNVGDISEGEYVTEYISSIMPDFEPIKLWTSLNTYSPIKINFEISKGAGFVSYSGHGFEYGFATSEYNSNSPIFYYLPYILGIQNGKKYPIMYFDACLTAALDFDYEILNIKIPPIAWAIIKKQNGGSIACIGSTRVGFGGFAGDPFIAGTSCLHAFFYEAYELGIKLGDMFIQAQQSFIEEIINNVIYDPLTLQEFILLGDPSLKIGGY